MDHVAGLESKSGFNTMIEDKSFSSLADEDLLATRSSVASRRDVPPALGADVQHEMSPRKVLPSKVTPRSLSVPANQQNYRADPEIYDSCLAERVASVLRTKHCEALRSLEAMLKREEMLVAGILSSISTAPVTKQDSSLHTSSNLPGECWKDEESSGEGASAATTAGSGSGATPKRGGGTTRSAPATTLGWRGQQPASEREDQKLLPSFAATNPAIVEVEAGVTPGMPEDNITCKPAQLPSAFDEESDQQTGPLSSKGNIVHEAGPFHGALEEIVEVCSLGATSGTEVENEDYVGKKRLQYGGSQTDFSEAIKYGSPKSQKKGPRMHSVRSENAAPRSSAMRTLQSCVFSDTFIGAVFIIIFSNVVILGVETDYRSSYARSGDYETELAVLQIVQVVYTMIFFVELVLRIIAEGTHFFVSSHRYWNWLDTAIVVLSMVDALSLLFEAIRGEGHREANWMVGVVNALRPLRVLRIIRLAAFIKEIRVLVLSIVATLKILIWALLLMFFVMFSFSMLFADAVSTHLRSIKSSGSVVPCDTDEGIELCLNWGSLPDAILSLFQAVTGGMDWNQAFQPLKDVSWMLVISFMIFFIFTTFVLLNVMTAVFCQTAIEAAQREDNRASDQALACREQLSDEMHMLLEDIDKDNSGTIDEAEIEEAGKSPRIRSFFASRGIESHEAWALFKMLDAERTGRVDVDSFVDGLIQFRGPARAIQIAKVVHDCKGLLCHMQAFSESVEERLKALAQSIDERHRALPPDSTKQGKACHAAVVGV